MALALGVTDGALIYIDDVQFVVSVSESESEYADSEIKIKNSKTGKEFTLGYDPVEIYPEVKSFLPMNDYKKHRKICFDAPRRIQIDRYGVYGVKKVYGSKN